MPPRKSIEAAVVNCIPEIGTSWFVPTSALIECSKSYSGKVNVAMSQGMQVHYHYFGSSEIPNRSPLFRRTNESLLPLPRNTLNVEEPNWSMQPLCAPFMRTHGAKTGSSAPTVRILALPLPYSPAIHTSGATLSLYRSISPANTALLFPLWR